MLFFSLIIIVTLLVLLCLVLWILKDREGICNYLKKILLPNDCLNELNGVAEVLTPFSNQTGVAKPSFIPAELLQNQYWSAGKAKRKCWNSMRNGIPFFKKKKISIIKCEIWKKQVWYKLVYHLILNMAINYTITTALSSLILPWGKGRMILLHFCPSSSCCTRQQ